MLLGGKLKKILTDFEDVTCLYKELQEGYIKLSWREKETLCTGIVFIKSHVPVAAYLEDVLQRKIKKGKDAFLRINSALEEGKIKIVELYETHIDSILNEDTKTIIDVSEISERIPGHNINAILKTMETFSGELLVYNSKKNWILNVKKGKIDKAVTITENKKIMYTGDKAVKELIEEIPQLIKKGQFEFKKGIPSQLLEHSKVKTIRNTILFDILELLKIKESIK